MQEAALSVSRAVRCLDLVPGDVVALVLPNCLEYPALVAGCLHAGLTVSPVNPAYTGPEISRQLAASAARLVVCHSAVRDKVQQAGQTVVLGTEQSVGTDLSWQDFLTLSSDPFPDEVPRVGIRGHEIFGWYQLSKKAVRMDRKKTSEFSKIVHIFWEICVDVFAR